MKKLDGKSRSLRLSKETLKQLTTDEISRVAAAGPSDVAVSYCVCPSKSMCWTIGDLC